jgi:uncharacterized membrane-anchored protein
MGYLPNISAPEMAGSASGLHYHTLIELSINARKSGDHQAAQQYATAAHKWAMDEHTRLQRLVTARQNLAAATRVLETAWDKDRTCTSIAELRERHPEFTRMITAYESAQQAVRGLG